jgi:carboxymethylenebutenolidase
MSTRDTSRPPLRPLAALAALLLLVAPAFAGPGQEGCKPKVETATFRSGGKSVAVEYSVPTKPGKYPAVVLLHAVDGIDETWGPLYRDLAVEYAGKGFVVVLVHYFDRTDPDKEERAGYRDPFVNHFARKDTPAKDRDRLKALFGAWGEAVRDAVAYTKSRPEVDGERVGLVGFSLGASLALAAAAEYELKLACLVELFGALPREYRDWVRAMPPTLLIHGDADAVVPVEEVYLLAGLLLARKQWPEVELLAGAEHMFLQGGTDLQRWPLAKAKMKTDAFLWLHLGEKLVPEADP